MAQEFVQKPYALNVFPHGNGTVKRDALTISNTAISLHAFKRSKADGYIIRMFNNGDKKQSCEISLFGKTRKLSFGKFEVKTLRFSDGIFTECAQMEI